MASFTSAETSRSTVGAIIRSPYVVFHLSGLDSNRIEVTDLHADTAADTGRIIDVMNLPAFTADRVHRAIACADCTAGTNRLLNFHANQRAANFRGAALLVNVRFVFMPEILKRAQNGSRRTLTKSTQTIF